MEQVKLIEVKSEIAAGTRGASLGVDALKIACLDKESDFFALHDAIEVETLNDILFDGTPYRYAKFIDGVLTMEKRMCEATCETLKEGFFPVVLAGDHATAAGTINGIKKAYPEKRLGVVWIDAHADFHSPYTTPSGNMHGMPLAMVTGLDNLEEKINEPDQETIALWEELKNVGLEGPKVMPSDIVFIAMRESEAPEQRIVRKYSMQNFTAEEVKIKGVKEVARETLEALSGCDLIYISFDVDSMDSGISEGTGTPVPGGLTVEEAKALNCELILDKKVCCWEMVEVNPTLDSLNLMAENAFDILEATTNCLLER